MHFVDFRPISVHSSLLHIVLLWICFTLHFLRAYVRIPLPACARTSVPMGETAEGKKQKKQNNCRAYQY